MRKITFATVWAVAAVAAASALEVGVGAFYAPARVVGYVDETREYSNKEFSMHGFKGRATVGIYEGFSVGFGLGYNNLIYREDLLWLEEQEAVESIPMFILTVGGDYAFPLGPFRPYAGGGAALAREHAEGSFHETVDWYGGLYVEGGARYFLTNSLALEAAPRYTVLFDEPVLYDDLNLPGFVRSEHRSQLIELLIGFNYYF
ncbi:MAG TPA: outer membrane beta-barrel protein [bacterium]|nr:outer membrane beta-barrel protein [bacterium]